MSGQPPPILVQRMVERRVPGIFREVRADLDAARLAFPGLVVTSWWRSPARNRQVGGAAASQHQIGLALDLAPPPGQRAALAAFMRRRNWHVIEYASHVHVQAFRATPALVAFVRSIAGMA